MGGVAEEQINEWIDAIATLQAGIVQAEDSHVASEAAANIWRAFGYQNAPRILSRWPSDA